MQPGATSAPPSFFPSPLRWISRSQCTLLRRRFCRLLPMTSCTKSCVKNCSRISFSRRCNFTAACFMVSLSRIHEKPYFRSRTNFQEFTNPKGLGYLHFNPLSWKSLIAHHVVAYRSNAGPSECKHQDHRFDHSGHLSLSAHCLPCFFVFRFGIRGHSDESCLSLPDGVNNICSMFNSWQLREKCSS